MKLDDNQIGRAALGAAAAGTVLAPLSALARFATEDGKSDLESGVVRAWAEPARDALEPLLDWASADTVYTTYGKAWTPILLAALLCALTVFRRRTPTGAEKWGWRMTLVGLVGMTIGVTGSYWTPALDEFFLVALPFMLIAMIGGIVLGIGLLRRGFRPRATAVLLIAWLPLFFVLSSVIAMGAALLPALWAWAIAGWSLATTADEAAVPDRSPARV
ncbi:MAG: hypothetical protein JJD92_00120 [Frankiaceae bacterium]|nr:hypothetical protein [Frankiaceae bacterium]